MTAGAGPRVRIRRGSARDAGALARLGWNSFVAKFGQLYRPEDLGAFLDEVHSAPAVAEDLADPAIRYGVAERDGRLAGYCKLRLACAWPEHARGARPVEVGQFYTHAAMTGLGIGSALMDWVLAAARGHGADEIQLSVWSGNDGAQRFYRRYGFEKVADIDFWVGTQRDDEFLYSLLL